MQAMKKWKLEAVLEYLTLCKAIGRISKRMFQENKARQIFRKTNISYPLISRRNVYQG